MDLLTENLGFSNIIMKLIFGGLAMLFSTHSFRPKSFIFRLVLQILHEFIVFGQNSPFFWYTSISLKGWKSTKIFWELINYTSIDYFSFKFQIFNHFVIAIIGMYFFLVAFFGYLIKENYYKRTGKPWVFFVVQSLMYILCDLSFIPILLTIFLVFKYSGQEDQIIIEYSLEQTSTEIIFGSTGKYIAIVFLVLHVWFSFIYEAVSHSLRYSADDNLEYSKKNAKSDLMSRMLMIVNCNSFFYFQQDNYQIYLVLLFFSYILIGLTILVELPYYSLYMNLIKFVQYADSAFVTLAFFVGYSSIQLFIITFSFLIQPELIILVYNILTYRISKLSSASQAFNNSFGKFELSIRPKLKSGIHGVTLALLSKHYEKEKNNQNLLLQAYFSLDILKDPSLAYTKVTIVKLSAFNILKNIQILKFQNICDKMIESNPISIIHKQFIDFLKQKCLASYFVLIFSVSSMR
jgi:hypothetical protein